MNRTIVGRITYLRGVRHQAETFLRQASELGNLAPFAGVFLLYVFGKTYQDEQKKMLAERTRGLKQEKQMFDKVERQLAREIGAKTGRRGLWRLLPARVQRSRKRA